MTARKATMRREASIALDAADPLTPVRERFEAAPEGRICLDGNSMGALPREAPERILHAMRNEWSAHRRHAWTVSDWLDAPQRIGAALAPLIGAAPDEVIAVDNTTSNLHKLLSYGLQLAAAEDAARRIIVYEAEGFPTNCHVVQGIVRHGGGRWTARTVATPAELEAALAPDVAMVVLAHADYRSSFRWDMGAVNRQVHAVGARVLWDLSHTAGAVTVSLDDTAADFAVACGYKYLCGGPGAPALAYIRRDLQDRDWPALPGWLGHADRMDFDCDYRPAPGMLSLVGGTMPVLQNVVMESAARIWQGVDPGLLAAKHESLSTTLVRLLAERCGDLGVTLACPADHARRGGHVAVSCPGGGATCEALLADGVIGSFRQPDVIRFGLSAVTLRHVDLWEAVERLRGILVSERWRDPAFSTVSV
jgi:kynureninase